MIITPITLKMVKFQCRICQKAVETKQKPICCDLCNVATISTKLPTFKFNTVTQISSVWPV